MKTAFSFWLFMNVALPLFAMLVITAFAGLISFVAWDVGLFVETITPAVGWTEILACYRLWVVVWSVISLCILGGEMNEKL